MSIADRLQRDLLEAAVEMARLHAKVLDPSVVVTADNPQLAHDYKQQSYNMLIVALDQIEILIK